ncbi:PLD nuclease N-terminal domain-containing protein [Leifsonia sp. Root112D2]|jgi:hypothetical protein|uniref:PLD nuclease N-terminal domain-containing protein n=1 Tax=Leifsonia sp. Root112D2 TaxID=1736426 RepID=UPI0006F1C4A4|nr:PLD nuclease N-terminal domain-containing protein [Leifsonia sp. Root112D2]KQV05170.1 hypothetical protein ASC63_15385 [Leifsonia sp. Root112D2]
MYALLSVVFLLVIVGALIDIITRQDGQIRYLPKVVWILLVVFLPLIGSILWFTIGREYSAPVDRGGFGDPRRSEPAVVPRHETRVSHPRTTEEELAALEREIEFHTQQDRIRRLEAELEKRRKSAE